jgi:myo-inositol-1(or 4)-monophosphatase
MADKRSEQTLIDELRYARPDWAIMTEESGLIEGDPNKPRWIIDPIDGTTNFLHGVPHFAISIAVEDKKSDGRTEISHGLVYQPLTDEAYWAEKGRGAWLNERRLRVSSRRHLDLALIGTGMPHSGRGDVATWARIYGAIAPQVCGVRRMGAASLDFAWVAAGRLDGFWEDDLDQWDSAAGILLVKEAGGFVSDYRGQDKMFERREYLAANGDLHSKLHKLLAGSLR